MQPVRRSFARRMLAASLASSLVFVSSLSPAEQWQISRPLPEGKQSPLSATPLQKQAAHDKELAEKYPVFFQRIEVEGVRDPDKRPPPPQTAEQRFADVLNEGSPELIAGRTYDGYYYDGTLFWGRDPLSFAWKNVTHWFGH